MKRMTTLLFAIATAGLLMGFAPQQEAPPAEKEAPAEAEAPAEEAAPAPAEEAAPAPAEEAAPAPAEAAPAKAVTCKKYVECACAVAKAGGEADCKAEKATYKGKLEDDCSGEFQSKLQSQLDAMAADKVPAKCK